MKPQILALTLSLSLIAPAAFADSNPIGDAVIANPVVQSLYSLLNTAHGGACTAPVSDDVHTMCMGALPEVTKPTIAGNSCGFFLQVKCADGTSLSINGERMGFEIVDQNHQILDSVSVGIVVENVKIQN